MVFRKNDGLRRTHGKSSVQHHCGECGKPFSSASSLSLHIRSVHNKVKYPCGKCSKQFTQKIGLKLHIQSAHEGGKYACDQCGKQFTYPGALRRHVRSVYEGVPCTMFPCCECGRVFEYSWVLRRHAKKHKKNRHVMRKHKCSNPYPILSPDNENSFEF